MLVLLLRDFAMKFLKSRVLVGLQPALIYSSVTGGGSKAAAASKIEHFVIIVNGFQPLTIITKRSILDVAAALDLSLVVIDFYND